MTFRPESEQMSCGHEIDSKDVPFHYHEEDTGYVEDEHSRLLRGAAALGVAGLTAAVFALARHRLKNTQE